MKPYRVIAFIGALVMMLLVATAPVLMVRDATRHQATELAMPAHGASLDKAERG
jgi:hypothetical protein